MENNISTGEKKFITGPAGAFFNTRGELLCVIEKEGEQEQKSRKRKGQLFVPAGKKRPTENMTHAMLREAGEETGIKEELNIIQEDKLIPKGELNLETEDTKILIDVFGHKTELETDVLEKNVKFFTNEIVQRAFFDIREILEWNIDQIRPGLYEIIYLSYGGEIKETVQIEKGKYCFAYLPKVLEIKKALQDLL